MSDRSVRPYTVSHKMEFLYFSILVIIFSYPVSGDKHYHLRSLVGAVGKMLSKMKSRMILSMKYRMQSNKKSKIK